MQLRLPFRVPLHLKVMVSYLVVVGLVLLPTLVYLRTLFRQSLIEATEKRMDAEVQALAARLAEADELQLPHLVEIIADARPQRVTITDAHGRVLADSLGERDFGNHVTRPEIAAALQDGVGRAVRTSSVTHNERIYVARPFPPLGPPRGVVRLSVPTHDLDDVLSRSYRFTEKAGALALSAALVLSLVAALVVSRPLRRLAEAIEAFQQGDLGHPVAVDSSDELGELADALRSLAHTLAGRLREAGAHRATLDMLIEELPLGVIVYDEQGTPLVVNARARELCRIPLPQEIERAREILRTAESQAATAAARERQTSVVGALRVDKTTLDARWLVVPGHPTDGRIIGLLTGGADRDRIATLEQIVRVGGKMLRQASTAGPDVALSARLEAAADEAERALLGRRASPEQVETREVGALCQSVLEDVRARAAARGVRLQLELDDPAVKVVEAQGRSQLAVRRLLDAMIAEAPANGEVRVVSESGSKQVRITARALDARRVKTKPIGEIIHCLGGDAGSKHTGDASEAWVKLPRG